MTRRARVLLAAVALAWTSALGGCAYYNGMYNTNRYARLAERSERAGRVSEAADRWRQVLVHADTLLVRHPHSRWADDAELLKGRALVALRAHAQAVAVLERAAGRAGGEEQRREAHYWLALAHAGRGAFDPALASFDSALAGARHDLRQRVALDRGRTLMRMGRPAEALRDLDEVSVPGAGFERARAALALGRFAEAAAHADSAVDAESIPREAWAAFLDTLGWQGGAQEASRLVDRLLERSALTQGGRARLLLADGDRWAAQGGDSVALVRWAAAAHAAPDSAEARAAQGREVRLILRSPDAVQRLAVIRARLEDISAAGGEPGREAGDVLRVLGLVDSVALSDDWPDVGAFQAAEWLRDSLAAPALAAERFVAMATAWPTSPWAPKALLAAMLAGYPAADSLGRVVRERYGSSPYASGVTGDHPDAAAYAALEDSLGLALEMVTSRVRATTDAGRAAAAELRAEAEADRAASERRVVRRPVRGQTATPAPRRPVRTAPERQAEQPRNPEP